MIVVKVGGSLFDSPALAPALRAFVESLAPSDVLLVGGGGPVADAVRELDRTHGLGEEAAHWLALRSLGVTRALLARLVSERRGVSPPVRHNLDSLSDNAGCSTGGLTPRRSLVEILDPFAFAQEDESRPGALPHMWAVTTDSIAARAALVSRAERLILLKSVDVPPGTPWEVAATNGWVDAHFPQIAPLLACPVEVVNFRRALCSRA
ncbi:MAG: hypothetical protein FJ304_01130 [Planctomycetes bacterium]|nr:hypothetical protein [Planctomycetota bacterium]